MLCELSCYVVRVELLYYARRCVWCELLCVVVMLGCRLLLLALRLKGGLGTWANETSQKPRLAPEHMLTGSGSMRRTQIVLSTRPNMR